MKADRSSKATVLVLEGGVGARVFEVITDDGNSFDGVPATQLSGPPLEGQLLVSELQFGISPPGKNSQDCTRQHQVRLELAGKRVLLEDLHENEVELFRRTAAPGERACFVKSEPV